MGFKALNLEAESKKILYKSLMQAKGPYRKDDVQDPYLDDNRSSPNVTVDPYADDSRSSSNVTVDPYTTGEDQMNVVVQDPTRNLNPNRTVTKDEIAPVNRNFGDMGVAEMYTVEAGKSRIVICQGKLVKFTGDAVVNSTTSHTVYGYERENIAEAGGDEVEKAFDYLPHMDLGGLRIPMSQADVTVSGNLPCKKIIHTVGPIYGINRFSQSPDFDLKQAYRNSLDLAVEEKIQSICFPVISGPNKQRSQRSVKDIVTAGWYSIARWCDYNSHTSMNIYILGYSQEEQDCLLQIAKSKNPLQNDTFSKVSIRDNQSKIEKEKHDDYKFEFIRKKFVGSIHQLIKVENKSFEHVSKTIKLSAKNIRWFLQEEKRREEEEEKRIRDQEKIAREKAEKKRKKAEERREKERIEREKREEERREKERIAREKREEEQRKRAEEQRKRKEREKEEQRKRDIELQRKKKLAEELKLKQSFFGRGEKCLEKELYPQAIFWFFQHRKFLRDDYVKQIDVAQKKCMKEYKHFKRFLQESYYFKEINLHSHWGDVHVKWMKRVKTIVKQGTKAKLRGLQLFKRYNDFRCIVGEYDFVKQRYRVKLQNDEKWLDYVLRSNLEIIETNDENEILQKDFQIGDRVEVRNLNRFPHYNFLEPTIRRYNNEKRKYECELPNRNKNIILISVSNLFPVPKKDEYSSLYEDEISMYGVKSFTEKTESKKKVKPSNTRSSYNSDVSSLDDGNWMLVRQVRAGSSWHPATDSLAGTDEYDDGNGTHSIRFSDIPFNQFLFASGDGKKWLIAGKKAVIGGWYAREYRTVQKSSKLDEEHELRWYRRQQHPEDPWISLTAHTLADDTDDMIYGENSSSTHSSLVQKHNGARVYIRDKIGFYDR